MYSIVHERIGKDTIMFGTERDGRITREWTRFLLLFFQLYYKINELAITTKIEWNDASC
jgi:hypothetical protein